MEDPILIAQTPRAGRWNHLNLLPTAKLPAGFRAGDYLGSAAFCPIGKDYVAVVRKVPQVDATKEGREVLALIGKVLPPGAEGERLLHWLESRLIELGDRVATIDWSKHDGSDYRLSELDQWMLEVESEFGSAIPSRPAAIPKEGNSTSSVKPSRQKARWVAACVALCVLVPIAMHYWQHTNSSAGPPLPPPPMSTVGEIEESTWKAFVEDVESDPNPKSDFIVGLKSALQDVGGHSLPDDFRTRVVKLTANATLKTDHPAFAAWLNENYPLGRDGHIFDPLIHINDKKNLGDLKLIERIVGGELRKGHDVRTTMRRIEKQRTSIIKIREIAESLQDMDKKTQAGQPLLVWAMTIPAGTDHLVMPIYDVPFLTGDMMKRCKAVQDQLDDLQKALQQDRNFHPRRPGLDIRFPFPSEWPQRPADLQFQKQVVKLVLKNWYEPAWANRDEEALKILNLVDEILHHDASVSGK